MGSAQSARRTQPGARAGRPGRGIRLAEPSPGAPAPAGRTFSVAVRRDRLRVGLEGMAQRWLGRLAPCRALQRASPTSPFPPGAVEVVSLRPARLRPGTGPPAPGATVDLDGLPPVRPDRVASPRAGTGPRTAGARGRRRCRLPTRPVLKHGPRSLTRARVRGLESKPRGAMKVKAGARRPRWDPGRSGAGRTTGPPRPLRRGGGA